MWILLAAVAVYFLFIRKPKAVVPNYQRSPPPQQQSTTQQVISAGASALPALGSFFGNLFGSGSSSSNAYSESGPAYFTGGPPYISDDDSFDYSS